MLDRDPRMFGYYLGIKKFGVESEVSWEKSANIIEIVGDQPD